MASRAEDTIIVGAGIYNENLTIDRAVDLISESGAGLTSIVGSVTAGSLGTVHVLPGVDDVTIGALNQGFTIVGYDVATPGIEHAAVYLQGAHTGITIQGNDIVSKGEGGLVTEYGYAVTHLTIDTNIFSGQTFVGQPASGNQFEVHNVPRALVFIGTNDGSGVANNVTFTNNQITGTVGGQTVGAPYRQHSRDDLRCRFDRLKQHLLGLHHRIRLPTASSRGGHDRAEQ